MGTQRVAMAVLFLASVGCLTVGGGAQAQSLPEVHPLGPQTGAVPPGTVRQQTAPAPADPNHVVVPLPPPRQVTPDMLELIGLEAEFADSVAKGGGKAFASWFAEDGMTLSNGKPPVLGRDAIERVATWDPKEYQLTWVAEGEQMGPEKESAFTWGHYDATVIDKDGKRATMSGRYITLWKKVKGEGGKKVWKVAMDASADEPPKL